MPVVRANISALAPPLLYFGRNMIMNEMIYRLERNGLDWKKSGKDINIYSNVYAMYSNQVQE